MSSKKRDYYQVLGVPKGASKSQIKKAYRKLARANHPDHNNDNPQAESRFKEISEAYAVLSNPEAKTKFDRFGHGGGGAGFEGFDFSGFDFQNFSGSFSGGGKTYDSGGFDINDLFGGIFGGGRRNTRRRSSPYGGGSGYRSPPQKGQDARYNLSLKFADAVLGTTTRLTVDTGRGRKDLTVRIPAGVDNGQTIRLQGKGIPSPTNGPPGDLLLHIKVLPDSVFSRKGSDIHCTARIPIALAALGGPLEVPTLDKSKVSMNIPAGTQGGQRFRVKGKGVPLGNSHSGDLYCTVNIAVPKSLDEKSKELIKQFDQNTTSSLEE